MHDPLTVAFELRYPWRFHRNPRNAFEREYREAWLVVWHRDPCVHGDDDSCGWSTPRVSDDLPWVKALEADLRFLCRDDAHGEPDAEVASSISAQRTREGSVAWELLWLERAAFHHRGRRGGGLTARHIAEFLFQESFPGDRDDTFPWWRLPANELARLIARRYLRLTRPWWRHPRWHVHHWRLQLCPWQTLRRWLFSRCRGCGKRFAWGYSPLSTSWSSRPPRLFRGEEHVYHPECVRLPRGEDAARGKGGGDAV